MTSAPITARRWNSTTTFAHYLHIRDTLQTAAAYGVRIDIPASKALSTHPSLDVEGEPFAAILADWLPLTYALNAINRSMGSDDLYPFVLSPSVSDKLTWAHSTVTAAGGLTIPA